MPTRVAIAQRKREAKRFNVQIVTTLHGHDMDNNTFEEVTMTRNISRLGACLTLSRSMQKDSPCLWSLRAGNRSWTRSLGSTDRR